MAARGGGGGKGGHVAVVGWQPQLVRDTVRARQFQEVLDAFLFPRLGVAGNSAFLRKTLVWRCVRQPNPACDAPDLVMRAAGLT